MADSERDAVRSVAARLADGQPVDWAALQASRTLTESEIGALRLFESIRTGRSPAGAAAGDAALGLEIGAGSGSRVHRAVDRALGRPVALKIVRPDAIVPEAARARFLAEARALAAIDHPNVVRIHSIDEVDGQLRLSLELVDGKTLEQIVESGGPLSPEEAARLGIDLCRALSAIHARGLVHRDLKPSNVMRATGGRTVLLDFGIVFSPGAVAAGASPGSHAGTPVAMAPEQFGGPVPVGPPTDIYALGVLLYWSVCGRYPHEAASFSKLAESVKTGRGSPLSDRRPDAPDAYASIVEKAMATDPARRFESAGAFERALRDYLSSGSAAPRPKGLRRAVPWLVAALAAAALATPVAIRIAGSVSPLEIETRLLVARGDEVLELRSGDAVRVGERLSLEVRCSRESHVYVLNQDDAGETYSMFPAPGYAPRNPLAKDATHRLPGDFEGRSHDWVVSSSGAGAETILVIASIEPDEAMESFLSGVLPVRPGEGSSIRRLDDEARTLLFRGIGQTAPAAAPTGVRAEPRPPRLEDLAATLQQPKDPRRTTRLIRLRNVP